MQRLSTEGIFIVSARKSVTELKLNGTYRKDEHGNRGEFEASTPKKPKWLSSEASKVWDDQISNLFELGYINKNDQISYSALCELSAEFSLDPMDFSASKMAQLRGLFSSFGMTPDSRFKMPVEKNDTPSNPFAELDS